MNSFDRFLKRLFDIVFSFCGLVLTWWLIVLGFIIASIDTREFGFFLQDRVGQDGDNFKIIKLRTMRYIANVTTSITTSEDPRITTIGRFLRRTKLDELPQLINILLGQMSFVGPRPDVPGFADRLEGEDRIILKIRPGISGPATLYFRNEETLLANQTDPEKYNREVIYPQKVLINRRYIETYSFLNDLRLILRTLIKV